MNLNCIARQESRWDFIIIWVTSECELGTDFHIFATSSTILAYKNKIFNVVKKKKYIYIKTTKENRKKHSSLQQLVQQRFTASKKRIF